MTYRKLLPLALLIGATILFSACNRNKNAGPTPKPTLPPEEINTIDVSLRPYARLVPSANGRNLTLTVGELKKPAAKGEYELEYQSGTVVQGAFGRIEVEDLPDSLEILLGSCSAGGKCSYHEDVTGGSVLLRLQDPEKYVLKSEWAFIENDDKENTISSRDGKFVATGTGIARVAFAVILQSPGYPAEISQTALSQIYSVGTAPAVTGQVSVSIRLNEDASAAQILAWDGQKWQTLKATVADKVATATSSKLFEAYMAVSAE